jgi:hypothetical protein
LTASPKLDIDVAPLRALPIEVASPRRYRRARIIGECVALAALFALSLEAACRLEDWVQFRTPLLALERTQLDLLVRDTLGMHGLPDGHFQKWSLNAFGMRGPDVTATKPPGVLRVVTVGASETFGLYESPGREYPRQLEDSLNARLTANRSMCGERRAEVLNAAMPGMSLPTIEQDIRLRVRALNPDFVVVYPTPAGYLDNSVPTAARPESVAGSSRLPASNALYPRVADRIRTQLKLLLPTVIQDRIRNRQIRATLAQHPAGWRFDSVPAERLKSFEADLRQTVGSIRSAGAIPVLMTHANRFAGSAKADVATLRMWEKFYPRASGRTIVAFDSAARLTTIAVARDSQAVLVDLTPKLAASNGSAFADYAHFTDFGAAVTATAASTSILAAPSENPGRPGSNTASCRPRLAIR